MIKRIDRILVLLIALVAALIAADAVVAASDFGPGFHAVLGLGSCVLVVLVSKALGRLFLQRPEDSDDA